MSLSKNIEGFFAPLRGAFVVFARNLDTNEAAEVNADQVLPTESAAKTFVLLHYGRLVASGECDPTKRVVVSDDFRFGGTGVLRYLSVVWRLALMTSSG